MAELKTKENKSSVKQFIDSIENIIRRKDCLITKKIMQDVTGKRAMMWGDSIVGFGSYHYKYASGREGDWFLVGFSPRKQNLAVYLMNGFEKHQKLLKNLGKHKTGKSCLYINKLKDINIQSLRELILKSAKHLKEIEL